jgi:hypothetical protein
MRERHRLDLVVRDVDCRDAESVQHVFELGAHVAAQLCIEIRAVCIWLYAYPGFVT